MVRRVTRSPAKPRPRRAEVVEPIVHVDSGARTLSHGLGAMLPRWGAHRSRRALRRDPSWNEHAAEAARVLSAHAWRMPTAPPEPRRTLRAIAWNIERGKRFEALCGVLDQHPDLADPDLLLLTEVDLGMGRSGNRDVAAELADRLGMGYVFLPSHLVLARGDIGEQLALPPNTLGLHGVALLTRWPVRRVCGVPLPEYVDKFRVLEKRLGDKRALLAEIELPDGPLLVAVPHLDPFASPRHRARQLRLVLRAAERFGVSRMLLGGDLNTTTYNLGSARALLVDIVHKLVRFGFTGTVAQYMTPERVFEKKVFQVLREAGLSVDGFNERERGTLYYDLNDPELVAKSRDYIPESLLRWLTRRLEPYDGVVPMRMDWFAGRQVEPVRSVVVDRPLHEGRRVSDHNPLVVDVRTG